MADVNLDVSAGRDRSEATPVEEMPFRIALVGDWSGRQSRGVVEEGRAIAARRPRRVDRDDLEAVLAELAPALALRMEEGGPALGLRFAALEDFHPDRLFQRLPLFQALRGLRQRLADPASFAAAARELSGEAPPPAAPPPGGLLDSILDEAVPPSASEALAESGGDLHAFLQRVVRPHLVPRPDPRQDELLSQVDAAAGATLRAILHHPDFQRLEALWRAADLLVRRIDTSAELQLHLVDISPAELAAALPAGGDPASSPFYQLLAGSADTAPWSLLAADASFGPGTADLDRLAQLAAIGQLLGAPWVATGDPRLAGTPSLVSSPDPAGWEAVTDPAWDLLRCTSLARSAGLVLPRFLMRLPYGRDGEECETMRFEELDSAPGHEDHLWGPPAFAVALILGRGFAESGWSLLRGLDPEVGGLPQVVRGKGAAAEAIPCGEVLLTERAAARLQDRGLMVLASLKDQDRVRLLRLQSVARPLAALAGRWQR